MFHAAVLLYLSVSAVMVGQKQAFGRNKLAGTAASEQYYGVFEGGLVDAVNVFCIEPEAFVLHVLDAL